MAKKRKFRPLIEVEGGGYKLKSFGEWLVSQGRAVIVNGRLRLNPNTTHLGYEAAPGYSGFSGKISYDPDMGGGPTVVQYTRRRPREVKPA